MRATIEAKWRLPALTNRDAQAHMVMDVLTRDAPPLERDALSRPLSRPLAPDAA